MSFQLAKSALQREPAYGEAALHLARLFRLQGDCKRAKTVLFRLLDLSKSQDLSGRILSPYARTILTVDQKTVEKEIALCQ